MIIGALTSLLPINLHAGNGVARTSPNPFSVNQTQQQDDSPSLSPAASFLSMLQKVQQQNPSLFKQITAQMATTFQKQAQTAAAAGDTSQAAQLKQLSAEFKNASDTGQLPSAQQLQQSGFGAHHGGHHGHHYGSEPTPLNDPQSLLNNILGTTSTT